MKKTLDIAEVSGCAATNCAYNVDGDCKAQAITVGDGVHPACDTFLPASERHSHSEGRAGVGACKVSACRHNRDFECYAEHIQVDIHEGHADCVTFEAA